MSETITVKYGSDMAIYPTDKQMAFNDKLMFANINVNQSNLISNTVTDKSLIHYLFLLKEPTKFNK